jgi:shikimate kinase
VKLPKTYAPETRHIALVGMMAVGKTTIGKLVAQELKRPFVDLDHLIIEVSGQTVAQLFASVGESGFREHERAALAEVLARPEPHVVSLGGGAVTTPACRQLLHDQAFVIWLRATPATLLSRIGDPASRPLLADDPEGAIKRLDAERRDLYSEVAHYALSVDKRSPRWVASVLIRRLRR